MGNRLKAAVKARRRPLLPPVDRARTEGHGPIRLDTAARLNAGSILGRPSSLVPALSRSAAPTKRAFLELQRTYGNRWVQRVVGLAAGVRSRLQRQDDPSHVLAMGSLDVHVQNGKTNAPIKGANVHIDQAGMSGPKTIDLTTNRNGDTDSIELEEGNYTITVTFWCCDPVTFTIHVDGGESNFQFVLMKNCDCRIASGDDGDGGGSDGDGTA